MSSGETLDPTASGVSTFIKRHPPSKQAWMARWALATGSSPAATMRFKPANRLP